MRTLFKPMAYFNNSAMRILAGTQLLVLLLVWAFIPLGPMPSPMEVLASFHQLASEQGLLPELATSAVTNLKAVALSALLSLTLIYGASMPILRPLVKFVGGLRFLGLAGLTFAFTLMLGSGESLKISLLVFGMTVFMVTNLAADMDSIPQERFDHARTLGLSPWRTVGEVVVLGRGAETLDIIRQNAAIGWMMLSMVEGLVRSDGGIGTMLLNQNKHFHLAAVFAIQLTILAVGLLQDFVLAYIQRTLCPYAALDKKRND